MKRHSSTPTTLRKKVETTPLVTFNRPEVRNAMSAELYAECVEVLEAAFHDDTIRCVILTGAGSAGNFLRVLKCRIATLTEHSPNWASSNDIQR